MEEIKARIKQLENQLNDPEILNKARIEIKLEAYRECLGYLERQPIFKGDLPKLPEFAAANFDHIAEISTRLTTGNVSHHARTIEGLAKRNAEFIRKHY
jgi:hypothetical protein